MVNRVEYTILLHFPLPSFVYKDEVTMEIAVSRLVKVINGGAAVAVC